MGIGGLIVADYVLRGRGPRRQPGPEPMPRREIDYGAAMGRMRKASGPRPVPEATKPVMMPR